MKRNEVFPKRFLSKADVLEAKDQTIFATISAVQLESVSRDPDSAQKAILYFENDYKPLPLNGYKPLPLNATNWGILEDSFGEDSDSWIGEQITIKIDKTVSFGGRRVGGLRVAECSVKIDKTAQPSPMSEATTGPMVF